MCIYYYRYQVWYSPSVELNCIKFAIVYNLFISIFKQTSQFSNTTELMYVFDITYL